MLTCPEQGNLRSVVTKVPAICGIFRIQDISETLPALDSSSGPERDHGGRYRGDRAQNAPDVEHQGYVQ